MLRNKQVSFTLTGTAEIFSEAEVIPRLRGHCPSPAELMAQTVAEKSEQDGPTRCRELVPTEDTCVRYGRLGARPRSACLGQSVGWPWPMVIAMLRWMGLRRRLHRHGAAAAQGENSQTSVPRYIG